ncbi:MAG: DNA replication/repair protein RecF [Bacilli bacterium]|nr:DNA replication/repair protein RecF [Bacilli bacterium]
MLVQNLYLKNFRNHTITSLLFNPGINVIVGPNTSGKTNIVEALYYLSIARSFRGVDDVDLIKKKKDYAEVAADVSEGQLKRHIHILIAEKGRSVVINGKKVSKLSELSKSMNVLLFEPKDAMMFKGSPKERRNFLDINLSKRFPAYLDYMNKYEKVLHDRNELLKSEKVDENLLNSYTEMLVKFGAPISNYREHFVKDINDILIKLTRALTGVQRKLEILYKPFIEFSDRYEQEATDAYKRALDSDIKHKVTSIGVHREDFSIALNGRDIATFGSQGENRLVALALKLSPYFLFEDKEKRPVVVLDDVMSELDKVNQERLIKFLSKFEQVFITATNLEIKGATHIKLHKSKEVF